MAISPARPRQAAAHLCAVVTGCALLLAGLGACRAAAPQLAATIRPAAAASATPAPTATATASATATPTAIASPTPLPQTYLLEPMSHEYQGWNNCGVVSTEMVLSYYGITRGQYEVAAALKPYKDDKHVGSGEILDYVRADGLEGRVCVNGTVARLQALIAAGVPVMIRTWLEPGKDVGHYVVLRGYDRGAGVLIANDSYFGPEIQLTEAHLEEIWAPFNHTYIAIYRPAQADEVCRILGEDCREDEMYRRAAEAAEQWTRQAPDDVYAWFSLGDDLLGMGKPDAAIEAYDKAEVVGVPPHMYWYQFGPFEALIAARRFATLLAASQPVLEKLPGIEELHLLRGQAYEGLGYKEQAIEEYRLAFEYHTNWAPAVEALQRLGAALPPVPTPTPCGTPYVPQGVAPTPTATGGTVEATPAEAEATPEATAAAKEEAAAEPTAAPPEAPTPTPEPAG